MRKMPRRANLRAIGKELKKAREISPEGVIGFNIMVATEKLCRVREGGREGRRGYHHLRRGSVPVGICAGGYREMEGLPRRRICPDRLLRQVCHGHLQDVGHESITSPRTPVVVEGPLAGGHLGFSVEQLSETGS